MLAVGLGYAIATGVGFLAGGLFVGLLAIENNCICSECRERDE